MLALEAGAEYGDDAPKYPYINLIMNQAHENTNAVKALRKKFDQWKDKQKS